MEYSCDIRRGKEELTVYGELWEDGEGLWNSWGDTGRNFEVENEPSFEILEIYNDENKSVSLNTLTSREIRVIIDIFTADYWDHVL